MCRQALAILVAPLGRWRLTAVLRRVAMTAGPLPVRIWDRSSPKVTSRIQCSTSIRQCPRIASATTPARAWRQSILVTAKLVTAWTVSLLQVRDLIERRRRWTWIAIRA